MTRLTARSMIRLAAAAALVAATIAQAQATQTPVVTTTDAPPGVDQRDVSWIRATAPAIGTVQAAVARPAGNGPFPAVILLHGTHGFAHEYVRLARDLARGGVIAVAPCWFAAGSGPGSRFVTAIPCPQAQPTPVAASPEAMAIVRTLIQAVRAMPEVRADRIALFGHSRGAGAVLNYVMTATDIRAAVLNSAGYPDQLADRVSQVNAPLLLLHGIADGPADGGSEMTAVARARAYEAALRKGGKTVEAHYYEDGGHNGLFTRPVQYDEEIKRMMAFLRRHLLE